ncbi:TPA: cupin domain-containing protein [Clostridioides difficile]|uniref:cupin domain-containing protein n=1 Tax=Clostridioides difficile TaxID=1496 RepID=UPI00038D178D|nr:cupin domain-containing protein [Clostridioides difficile]EII6835808.1 cupin domain-containing protein [Clostridioides difficile]EIJ0741049.1 cupin domain-containing protein [Clostridioides difficile]EQI00750.1 helix-turn-helix family protein [Clostridioides difficile F314]MBF4709926.1 cupin domain-containing protein [Clostridioides difficile]MBG0219810.1 cupin domain-containing protein [Clostridioides difficile]
MNIDVGSKIRSLRKSKNISISTLAKNSDLSTGLISQIERNMVVPSIVAMWKISKALDINIGYFFEEIGREDSDIIVKKNNRKKIVTNDSTKFYELLVPNLSGKKIEFILVTLDGHTQKNSEFVTHEGEECGYIIKGKMKITLGNKEYLLEEGDSFYFNSTIPHVYENYDDEVCISVWAMTPPSF